MGLGVLWRLVLAMFGKFVGTAGEAREDFKVVNDASEKLIGTLQHDNDVLRQRCDSQQRQIDSLAESFGELRLQLFDVNIKLRECERRHAEDGERIQELEQTVAELKRGE